MSNVSVSLTPFLKEWAESKVKSGRYNNVSEVVREALRLLEIQDREREARLIDLRAAIQAGFDSGEPQPWEGAEEIIRQARERRKASLADVGA
jgi:antitoxin ParD1/3/4